MVKQLSILALLLFLAATSQAATITIVNNDGPSEGFNDPTPATPVGGNDGTTVGEQRLIAFQYAADVWGSLLVSDVEIRITASFDPLTCSQESGVLGSAGPRQVFSDFTNAPLAATWYPVALANKIADADLAPGAGGTSADDIRARFNVSIDGNDNCLQGTDWYYGLDGNNGNDIDLVVVLLHEFGHGLGFVSLVDETTGSKFNGEDDIFSNFLYDNDLGLTWDQMSNTQRRNSAINSGRVAFSGANATAQAPFFLGGTPELRVTAPAAVAGTYEIGEAAFGPTLADGEVSGTVVLATDGAAPVNDICQPVTNAGEIAGNIAILDRGSCTFVSKVQAAQDAGAIGVIVVNNVFGAPITMGGSGTNITIPSVMVSQTDGALIKEELANGVFVTLGVDESRLAGTDPLGQPLVFTPNPVEPGSSVSHFDVSASPNLLMEPSFTSSVSPDGVDLTLALFRDLGWFFGDATSTPDAHLVTELKGNFPNPFNPSTTIRFSLEREAEAELGIFDARGRTVRTLNVGRLPAGEHGIVWDGRNDAGRPVGSGVYFYRLEADGYRSTQRMVLLK